jgi:hypothetical protein
MVLLSQKIEIKNKYTCIKKMTTTPAVDYLLSKHMHNNDSTHHYCVIIPTKEKRVRHAKVGIWTKYPG